MYPPCSGPAISLWHPVVFNSVSVIFGPLSFWSDTWTQLPEDQLFYAIGDPTRPLCWRLSNISNPYLQPALLLCLPSLPLALCFLCHQASSKSPVYLGLRSAQLSTSRCGLLLRPYLSHLAEAGTLVLLLSEHSVLMLRSPSCPLLLTRLMPLRLCHLLHWFPFLHQPRAFSILGPLLSLLPYANLADMAVFSVISEFVSSVHIFFLSSIHFICLPYWFSSRLLEGQGRPLSARHRCLYSYPPPCPHLSILFHLTCSSSPFRAT